jgi:hypothetical protein
MQCNRAVAKGWKHAHIKYIPFSYKVGSIHTHTPIQPSIPRKKDFVLTEDCMIT